jgi:choline-glycine betaine transporter
MKLLRQIWEFIFGVLVVGVLGSAFAVDVTGLAWLNFCR